MGKKILLAGESWMSYITHVKGFDTFYTSVYESGEKYLKEVLVGAGHDFEFMPNHLAMDHFPFTLEELMQYDVIILSDIGANTLLLPTATFTKSQVRPNRCDLLKEYVLKGGSLLMVGGYMTFSGIDGKGKWQDTAVQDILPVKVLPTDDRMEYCQGIEPKPVKEHFVLDGVGLNWPKVLGYNKTVAKEEAEVIAKVGEDPFIAVAEYGEGRSAAFTTDCAPHWAPAEFCEWDGYGKIFLNLVKWLTKEA